MRIRDEKQQIANTGTDVQHSDSSSCDANRRKGTGDNFHNVGLEAFLVGQQSWRNGAEQSNDLREETNSDLPPISEKELASVVEKATRKRRYELPRSAPLKDVIRAYVLFWEESDAE